MSLKESKTLEAIVIGYENEINSIVMKMIYCTCNVSVFEALMQLIEENGVANYQAIEQLTAKSSFGSPKLNNSVWPGYNSGVLMQINDNEKAKEVLQAIKDLNVNAFNENELVTACIWEVDEIV